MSKSSIKHFRYKVHVFLEYCKITGFEYKQFGGSGMWMVVEDISHLSPEDKILYEMLQSIDLKILFKNKEIREKSDERLKEL